MNKALLLLLLTVSASHAATYYVDNCIVIGSDSNNGTNASTPWLTIAHVNSQTFNPGDSILFQRGCIWHEKLLPPSSGSSVSQITFADYGSGNKPILDGASAPTHWGSGGGAYALQDTFESGTYSSNWSSTQGSVNTWAGFGITGPTGGGTYGAVLASAQQCAWNGANGAEYWFETWVQAGASAAARTYVGQFGNGANPIVAVMLASSSDPTPNKLRVYNYAAPAGSQEFYGTTVIAASTWYKVKARVVISATVGEIDIWLNSGSGWSLEFAQSGVNTGSANITRVSMGYSSVASQTSYFDYFQIAATDPSLPASTYLFSTLTTNPLTSAPINLTRVWYGNIITNITEYPQNSGAGSSVSPGQWDITGSNAGLSSIVWVATSGNIAKVEWPTIDYDVRIYGQSYLTFQNLMFMRALVRGMNHGTNSQPAHNQILYCDFWDNNGSGSYVNKDGTIYGIDSYTFSHNTFYRNYIHTAATVYQGGSGHGVYCTKCTNTLIEYSDCQNNGNYCTQLQDASNYNTYRYSRSIGEQGLLSLTTDLIGGSTGNSIYDNISVNEYQCVIATSATGNYLYHNTFAGFSYRGFANNSGPFGVVENNIFWTTVPGAQAIFTSAGTGFTSNFNIYGAQQSNFIYSEGTYYSTLSAWGRAGAQDKTGDPLFAALAGNNVTVTSSSPAHGAGVDLSATVPYGWSPISPFGFPPALLSRSVLGKYDIGAFVYLPGGPGTLLGGSVTPGGIVTTK
jgi:hypothetical protein